MYCMNDESSPKISVVMPAYNGERFIKRAIESVLTQTYPNWELIVVDDGSTDNTAQVVSNFKDSRIHYTFQKNRGQAAALNHGLNIARGEYITTLDVDDWFTPNSLADRAVFLDNHPYYDVVYGDGIFCDMDGNQLKRFSELRTDEVSGDVFDTILSNSFFGTGANVMVRKSILEEHLIRYDESIVWCQDYDFYVRLAEKCKFGYVDSLTVWYRIHQDNMTLTMPYGQRRESLVRAKLKALASERFNRVPNSQKVYFFQSLLIHDLDNDTERQMELMDHLQFQTLSKYDQARLIRMCASGYLATHRNMNEVKQLLKKSWSLNSLDPKTFFLIILAYFNNGPIGWIFNVWREMKQRNQSTSSPFDQIK
jgi:glycosyltransferase involved in cell wall biosynthesis